MCAATGAKDAGSRGELLSVREFDSGSADQAPTTSGAAQTIEPQEARVPPRSLFVTLKSLFEYLFVSVSINIRNGVTGSLGDPATLKLVDQED